MGGYVRSVDSGADLGGELVDGRGPFAQPLEQGAGQPGDHIVEAGDVVPDLVVGVGPVRGAGARLPCGIEFVQVPEQPADQPGSFGDQRFAVVDQQPDLTVGAVQVGGRQVRLPQRGA